MVFRLCEIKTSYSADKTKSYCSWLVRGYNYGLLYKC
jgi:hypothetical protein